MRMTTMHSAQHIRAIARAARPALAAAVLLASTASAQRIDASVSLAGGSATDQRGIHSSAATIAPSLLIIPDEHLSLGLSGSGTRFQSGGWAASGSGTLGVRVPLGAGLALAASGAGTGTTTSFDARYLVTEATPTLEATFARVTLFGGAHLARGQASLPAALSPTPLGTPSPSGSVTTTRTSTGPVYGAVLALNTDQPDVGGALIYREERATVEAIPVLDRTLGLNWSAGAVALSANVGMRDARDEQGQFGGVSATVGVTRSLAVQGAAGSYMSSRTLGTPGGRYATLGLVLRGSSNISDAEPVVAAGAPKPAAGTTRLAIRAPGAKRVDVAGSWNQWAMTPATRASDGTWYADVRLPRGEYRYAFRINGERWAVPDGASTVDDGFGGRSALLTVQ